MKEKKRGVKLVLLFFIVALILALAGTFLFIRERTQAMPLIEKDIPPFKVDQILIKVLIKDDETMVRPINIMDISEYDLYVSLETWHLSNIVSISDDKFSLKSGQTKTVYLNFDSFIEEKGIRHEPGIYIGSLIAKSDPNSIRTPIILEIETKEVLFDANMWVPIGQKQIKQGDYLDVQITLFNLKKIGLTNLNMEYFIKDISGNTIITETESITVETQTSFVKTMHIPENLNPGEYVFGAIARYGSSVGTSTFLFDVAEPEVKKEGLIEFYRDHELLCLVGIIILAIIISVIGSHISFLIRLFSHGKTVHHHVHHHIHHIKRKPGEITREEKKEEKRLIKKEIKHKFRYKKLFLLLLFLVIILSIIAYLFYSKIITLEQLNYSWNLAIDWLKDTALKISEFGKSIVDRALNWWDNTKPGLYDAYTNSLNLITRNYRKYTYHVWGIIIGAIALICFMIIAKKKDFFKRLKARSKQRKKEKKIVKKELEAKKVMKKKAKFKIFEKFKRLPTKEKIIISIILVILFLIVLVSVLIDLGMISAEQLGIGNFAFLK